MPHLSSLGSERSAQGLLEDFLISCTINGKQMEENWVMLLLFIVQEELGRRAKIILMSFFSLTGRNWKWKGSSAMQIHLMSIWHGHYRSVRGIGAGLEANMIHCCTCRRRNHTYMTSLLPLKHGSSSIRSPRGLRWSVFSFSKSCKCVEWVCCVRETNSSCILNWFAEGKGMNVITSRSWKLGTELLKSYCVRCYSFFVVFFMQ